MYGIKHLLPGCHHHLCKSFLPILSTSYAPEAYWSRCQQPIIVTSFQVMGKGIPDIVAGQSTRSERDCTSDRGDALFQREAVQHAHDAIPKEGRGQKTGAMVDRRIHLLDRARRRMSDTGAEVAAACTKARTATEPGTTRWERAEG